MRILKTGKTSNKIREWKTLGKTRMEKPVCVTGAGGFIASWIVRGLLERGYRVHATVRNPDDDPKYGHLKRLDGAEDRLQLFKADVLDYESIAAAVRGCSGVFHTACPVGMKFNDPDDVLAPSIQGTRNVMKACLEENVTRVVMTSSTAAVVADPNRPSDKVVDESCWSDIEHCRRNKLWYFVAKTESEKLAWELAEEYKLELVVLCPSFVFGPYLQPALNFSVEFLKSMMTDSSYPNQWIRLVDVRDVADGHILAMENTAASGRYNCFGHVVHHKDIIDALKERFPEYQYPDKCEGEETNGLPPKMVTNEKFMKLLSKDPLPYEQTLVDTVKCFQEQGLLDPVP